MFEESLSTLSVGLRVEVQVKWSITIFQLSDISEKVRNTQSSVNFIFKQSFVSGSFSHRNSHRSVPHLGGILHKVVTGPVESARA